MKLYSIKKQVRADNISEALKKEQHATITDVWVEDEPKRRSGADCIGFHVEDEYNDEE